MGSRRALNRLQGLQAPPPAAVEPDPWAGEDEQWADEDFDREEPARVRAQSDDEDILAPARALVVGFLLVLPLWLVIGAIAYGLYRAL